MITGPPYRDRKEAGRILAAHLKEEVGITRDAVVLALPRGGVPVGLEVALAFDVMLDVFVVRKIGMPGHEEFAIGAIAAGGFKVLNESAIAEMRLQQRQVDEMVERETKELERRERLYRGNRAPVSVVDRVVVLVDDGLATGSSMQAAIAALRASKPRRIIPAVPVGAPDACSDIGDEVGTVVCPLQPKPFRAVGLWYQNFDQTTDDEVRECLAAAALNYEAFHHSSNPRVH